MTNIPSTRLLTAAAILCFATISAHAQTTAPTIVNSTPGPGRVTKSSERPTGINSPVPAVLSSARKVFLSNAGADAGLFPHPFTGTQDRAYGSFYTMLAANPALQLVSTPAEADIVLELALKAPTGSLGGDKSRGTEDALPDFKLTIYDRPTHYILWSISQTIDKAQLQKTHDKNFDDALALLSTQFTALLTAGK